MDLFIYFLLFARFILYIVFAFVKIFWFIFVILGIKIVINILRKIYGNDSRCTSNSRNSDIIDLFPTDTGSGSIYSIELNRSNLKRIKSDNKFI